MFVTNVCVNILPINRGKKEIKEYSMVYYEKDNEYLVLPYKKQFEWLTLFLVATASHNVTIKNK